MARARHRRITGWPRVRAARRLLPARALRAPLLARDAPLPRLHLQRDGQPHHRNGRESHTGGNVMTRTPSLARQIIVAAVILIAVVAVAAGGSLATMGNVDGWYADAEKVPSNPPNVLLGPVWSVLYLMIALSGFVLWRWAAKDGRRWDPALTVYVAQLALNAAWTPIFFAGYPVIGEAAWWIALIVILALIVS